MADTLLYSLPMRGFDTVLVKGELGHGAEKSLPKLLLKYAAIYRYRYSTVCTLNDRVVQPRHRLNTVVRGSVGRSKLCTPRKLAPPQTCATPSVPY
jgi:hypothetical protein